MSAAAESHACLAARGKSLDMAVMGMNLDILGMLDAGEDWPAAAASVAPPPTDPWAASPVPGSAERIASDDGSARYRATAGPNGGFLVTAAQYFPGWRAWVDGQEAPVLRANSLFRTTPLPPGTHIVELRYQPGSVELGLLVSLGAVALAAISLLATVAAPLRARLRRRADEFTTP